MIQPVSDRNALEGCRLLLAENNMALALSLAFFLESYGCYAVKAARCEQVLTLMKTQTFDIALLDVKLADGPVYPAAEALSALAIPFIFLTGFSAQNLPDSWRDWPVLEKTAAPETIAQQLITLYRDNRTPGSLGSRRDGRAD